MNYIQRAEHEAERIVSRIICEAYSRNKSIVECDYRPDNYNDILRDFTDASGEFHRDLKEEMIKALLHDDEQEMQDVEVLIDMAFEKALMEEKEREQEAIKEAWLIAQADLEEANDFYEIPKDDAYEIEPLAFDYEEVRNALEDLIASLQGYGLCKTTALINLEEEIQNAVSDIKDELVRQEQLREEYLELHELE